MASDEPVFVDRALKAYGKPLIPKGTRLVVIDRDSPKYHQEIWTLDEDVSQHDTICFVMRAGKSLMINVEDRTADAGSFRWEFGRVDGSPKELGPLKPGAARLNSPPAKNKRKQGVYRDDSETESDDEGSVMVPSGARKHKAGEVEDRAWKTQPYSVAALGAVRALMEEAKACLAAAQQQGLPPDDGALLMHIQQALLALGVTEPSFHVSRLGAKQPGAIVRCLKIMALCPMKAEDLEGDSKSGQALRAALRAMGLGFGAPPSAVAPYQLTVLWRNLRGMCWRKNDDSGCVRPKGGELELLDALDVLWNVCVERGGWRVISVLAMSQLPAEVTFQASGSVRGGRGYSPQVYGVQTAHPIDLACEGRQRKGQDRVLAASHILHDLCKAVARTGARGGGAAQADGLYDRIHATPYFALRSYSLHDLQNGPSAATAAQLASDCARANANGCRALNCSCTHPEATGKCSCAGHRHDSNAAAGGNEAQSRNEAVERARRAGKDTTVHKGRTIDVKKAKTSADGGRNGGVAERALHTKNSADVTTFLGWQDGL